MFEPDDDKTRTYVPLADGTMVSHYRIIEKIGSGGMGEVYLAEDTALNRKVALKFLPLHLCQDADCRARFKREAQAAAKLSHPNIVTIYEVSEYNGRPFFAMENVEGQTVHDFSKDKELSLSRIIELAIQVCEGLAKAHSVGIVHRDIKPSNILIDQDGRAKIVDFGLASVQGSEHLTKAGSTLGTVGYMSPEQARGEEVDARSDLFSFGVVLYELITGRSPFKAESEIATIKNVIEAVPEPLARYKNDVPDELQRSLSKALTKDKNLRYQHADEITVDLRALLRNTPHVAPRKLLNWKRPVLIGGGVLLVAIVVLGYLLVRPNKSGTAQTSIAVLPFVDMSPQKDQEYFCDGMAEELINRLSNIQALRVPARTSAFYFKGKTDDVSAIGGKLKVQMVLEGSVRKAGDELRITAQLINVADGYHLWSETYDRKLEDIFTIQDEISSAIVAALELKLTSQEALRLSEHPIDDVRAYDCYLKASRQIWRFDEKSLDSAIDYLQTAIDITGDNAILYSGMAWAYWQYANIGIGQEDHLRRAEEYAKKAVALKPNLSSALAFLGMFAYYEEYPQNLHDSFRYLKRALAANPFELRALHGMSNSYSFIGRSAEASAMADTLEHNDPLNPWRHMLRGFCYRYDCQFGPALEQFRLYYQADSTSPIAQIAYSWGLAYGGKRDQALAVVNHMEKATAANTSLQAGSTFPVFCLLLKYALLKDKEGALRVMTPEFQKTCRRDLEFSYWVADALSLLGAKEEALDWLENSVHSGFISYPCIKCDPFLDNIRNEEGFKKLMARVKYEWEHFEV